MKFRILISIGLLALISCNRESNSEQVVSVMDEIFSNKIDRVSCLSSVTLSNYLSVLIKEENRFGIERYSKGEIYCAKGLVYMEGGEYVSALENFKKSQNYYRSRGDNNASIDVLLCIAALYCRSGRHDVALMILESFHDSLLQSLSSSQLTEFAFLMEQVRLSVGIPITKLSLMKPLACIEYDFHRNCSTAIYCTMIMALIFLFGFSLLLGWRQSVKFAKYKSDAELLLVKTKSVRRKLALSKNVLCSVDERLRLLDFYIASVLYGNSQSLANSKLIEFLKNKDYFLMSTQHSFLVAHPQFLRFLIDKGLSDEEISCCCLFVSGLKGKIIFEYLGWKRGYDRTLSIRNKLDLYGTTVNLETFLKRKLQDLDR